MKILTLACRLAALPSSLETARKTFRERLIWLQTRKDAECTGISWTGGNTLGGLRKFELDRLESLVNAFPEVHWVSLQYKDTPLMGLPIHHWKYATETNDYDNNAALVAELDLVITVPQAVAHVAGGLGKETWVMAPDVTRWIYGKYGPEHPWYGSVTVFRGWETMLEQITDALKKKIEPGLKVAHG
jgi:hypothetical protein